MKRYAFTIISCVLVLLLVALAGILPFFERNSMRSGASGFTGTPPQGIPSDSSGGQFGEGQGVQPPDGMPAIRPDEQGVAPGRNQPAGSQAGFLLLQGLRRVAAGSVTLLGLIAVIGLWRHRGWGTALAVISAMITLGLSVPSLFRVPAWSALILPGLRALLAVLVIIFALLALKKRKSVESQS